MATKITTDVCKARIVELMRDESYAEGVIAGWTTDPTERAEILSASRSISAWKRETKTHLDDPVIFAPYGDHWERCFDCRPLDGQLRAYIITDPTDANIVAVRISQE